MANSPSCKTCVVVRRTGGAVEMQAGRDRWYHELMASAAAACPPAEMAAEDPLFILYTSGSTGKPKGAPNPTRGHQVLPAMPPEPGFDHQTARALLLTASARWVAAT